MSTTAASSGSNAIDQDGSDFTRGITNAEKFSQYFQQEVAALQDRMDKLQTQSISGGERTDAAEHCQDAIARVSDSVKDASAIILAYDRRTYGEAIKALTAKLQEIQTTFAPKPKFSFRKGSTFTAKKNASAISINDAAEMANQQRRLPGSQGPNASSTESSMAPTPAHLRSPATERAEEEGTSFGISATVSGGAETSMGGREAARVHRPSLSQSGAVRISGHSNAHIILPPSASHATTSGTLANLEHCIVDLSSPTDDQPFASLNVKHVKGSLVICGRVSGPIHLTDVTHCVIVVASRQFRMHDSHNTYIYLQTSSRPIIEDCTSIAFAPLPEQYKGASHEQCLGEQWKEIDDFKWLRSEPSPNWRVLEPQMRVGENVWRNMVKDGAETELEDILKAVKLPH